MPISEWAGFSLRHRLRCSCSFPGPYSRGRDVVRTVRFGKTLAPRASLSQAYWEADGELKLHRKKSECLLSHLSKNESSYLFLLYDVAIFCNVSFFFSKCTPNHPKWVIKLHRKSSNGQKNVQSGRGTSLFRLPQNGGLKRSTVIRTAFYDFVSNRCEF